MERETMNVKDIAKYLNLHPISVYRLANAGKLPVFRVGAKWATFSDVLDRWLDKGVEWAWGEA